MIDRSANLRAIVTGRGNSAGFTAGARACYKSRAHSRMRKSGKEQIAEQISEMEESALLSSNQIHESEGALLRQPNPDETNKLPLSFLCGTRDSYGTGYHNSFWDAVPAKEESKHQERLARRRARYRERKIVRQVEEFSTLLQVYERVKASLKKLESRLEPESRQKLSDSGLLSLL